MTDRQTDEVHVEITRKGLSHTRPNNNILGACKACLGWVWVSCIFWSNFWLTLSI